uniref:HAUS augmin-like complex subunit 6 N-terminal domain-containing protein n=1 Tax=Clastoptera arizonana TaxID=38151 RepID=A0A1B6CUI1_9HEMI
MNGEEMHTVFYKTFSLFIRFNPPTKDVILNFSEQMFVSSNKKGLYAIMHFLISILDPIFLKNNIDWPLLDIKMEQEFKKKVQDFMAEIYKKDPNTNISNIRTSIMLSPYGNKIVTFLTDLILYVMQKQLTDKFNLAPPVYQAVQQIEMHKLITKTLITKTKILKRSILCSEDQHENYKKEKNIKMRNLTENINNLKEQIKDYKMKILTFINSSHLPLTLKTQKPEDYQKGLEEWIAETTEKIISLEQKLQEIERINVKSKICCDLIKTTKEWIESRPILDGNNLRIPQNLCKTSYCNEKNEVVLESFINYSRCISNELRNKIENVNNTNNDKSKEILVLETLTELLHKIQKQKEKIHITICELQKSICEYEKKVGPYLENDIFPDELFRSPKFTYSEDMNKSTNLFIDEGEVELVQEIKKNLKKKRPSLKCSLRHNLPSRKSGTKIPRPFNLYPVPKETKPTDTKLEEEKENKQKTGTEMPLSKLPKRVLYFRSSELNKNKNDYSSKAATARNKIKNMSSSIHEATDMLFDVSFSAFDEELNNVLSSECSASSTRKSSESMENNVWDSKNFTDDLMVDSIDMSKSTSSEDSF